MSVNYRLQSLSEPRIPVNFIAGSRSNSQIATWFNQGWILEKPKPKQVKALLADLGLVLYQGYWIKR